MAAAADNDPASSRASRRAHALAIALIVLAVAVLFAALAVPWYAADLPKAVAGTGGYGPGTYSESWGPWSVAFQYPPLTGSPCPGPGPVHNCTAPASGWTSSFDQASLPDLAGWYLLAAAETVTAAVLGAAAAVVAVLQRPRLPSRTRSRWVGVLLTFAVMFAVLAPALVAVEQPAVVCADWNHYGPVPLASIGSVGTSSSGCGWVYYSDPGGGSGRFGGITGPGDSFVGNGGTNGASWGPATGWYLPFLAAALLAGALALELLLPPRPGISERSPVKPI